MTITFCTRCGAELKQGQKFCGNCGLKLEKLPAKKLFLFALAAVAVWGAVLAVSSNLIGTPPTKQFAKTPLPAGEPPADALHQMAPVDGKDFDANEAEKAADSPPSPQDVAALTSRAFTLVDAIVAGGSAPETVLEALDVLSKLVQSDPNNSWALLQLAELSFSQQVFEKAAKYYERYLKIVPDDSAVRARYAGSLNFIGKSSEAVAQLEPLRQADPGNFQILGYLAVSYAQEGNVAKAKELGELALQKAPDESARARFSKFVDKLNSNEQSIPVGSATAATDKAEGTEKKEGTVDLQGLQNYLKNHPIAGRFFIGVSQEADTVVLNFNNFPMEAMPEFVRNKFISNVTEQLPAGSNLKLKFVESASGKVLYQTHK